MFVGGIIGTCDSKRWRESIFTEVCSKIFGCTEEYDAFHRTELVHTLQVLIENMGIRTKAAEALFLHRNTLLRRLQKIEMLTGVDLSDGNQLLQLGIALQIRPYVGGVPMLREKIKVFT